MPAKSKVKTPAIPPIPVVKETTLTLAQFSAKNPAPERAKGPKGKTGNDLYKIGADLAKNLLFTVSIIEKDNGNTVEFRMTRVDDETRSYPEKRFTRNKTDGLFYAVNARVLIANMSLSEYFDYQAYRESLMTGKKTFPAIRDTAAISKKADDCDIVASYLAPYGFKIKELSETLAIADKAKKDRKAAKSWRNRKIVESAQESAIIPDTASVKADSE